MLAFFRMMRDLNVAEYDVGSSVPGSSLDMRLHVMVWSQGREC